MTDAEAVAALTRGDVSVLDVLVVRHGDRAQRLAHGILRNPALVHDVVADCFVLIVSKARTFDPTRPFGPWFDRIVVTRSINLARAERRRGRLASLLHRTVPVDDPAGVAQMGEVRAALAAAFGRLTPRDRAVITLRLVLDRSERETAEILSCAPGTVKSRLVRARRQLRTHLGESGITATHLDPQGDSR